MPKQSFNFALFLFTYYAHAGTFATYASLFFAARGMTAPQIGILMALIQVMRIIGPNVWGWVADHTQRRVTVLRATALAACVAFTGIAFGRTFAQLFVAMIVLNLFTSAQGPLLEAHMLSEMRGDLSNYGRLRLWGSLGFIAAVMLSGVLLDRAGITSLPWLAGAMLLCVLAASLRVRATPGAGSALARPALLPVLRQPAVIAFFSSTALMVAAHTALYVFYSLYLAQLGFGKTVIGAMWSLGVLAEVVFFYFQAPVLRRVGAQRLMMAAFAIGVVRFLIIGADGASIVWLVLAQLLHAATFAAHHAASITLMQRWFGGALQARGQALFTSIAYGIGGSCGGLLMAACWDRFGASAVYYLAALLCALAAVAQALSLRWQRDICPPGLAAP